MTAGPAEARRDAGTTPRGGPIEPADFWFGLFWAGLGGAIAIGSWRMDRLESQGVEPYAVPGLVPGMLGVALLGFGLVLALRGWRGRAPAEAAAEVAPSEGAGDSQGQAQPWRIALALLLTLGFGLGVLGHGPPFWLAAFGVMFLAIFLFELPERRAAGTVRRGALVAAAVAAVASGLISFVFQEVFLVRLP